MYITVSGTPDGSETLTVNPATNSIYDLVGNVSATSQINNTINLIEKIVPFITSISINNTNTEITVTFNETIYNTASGSGIIGVNDFVLSLTNNEVGVTLASTPPGISPTTGNTNEYILYITVSGTPDGSETLTVNPATNSIYDLVGNVSATSQINNTINLIEKIVPFITSISINNTNTEITVTFNETIYNTASGSGIIGVNDFVLSLTNNEVGVTLASTPPGISPTTGNTNEYILYITVSGTPDGSELLTVNPTLNSIYDSVGNVAITSQLNNHMYLIPLNPYTTTDYRYYMWESNNTPLLAGVSRGEVGRVHITSKYLTATHPGTIIHMENGGGVYWAVPPNYEGQWGIDHFDNDIYPDENIFEISYVTTVGGIPEYTIIGYHNAGAGVFLNWFGSNVRINSLFSGATQYWQIQKTSDSTIFKINGNTGTYGGVLFTTLPGNSDHHYMSFNFIPIPLHPYTTTDYRYYMWESNNTPLLAGVSRGEVGRVHITSKYLTATHPGTIIHMENGGGVYWAVPPNYEGQWGIDHFDNDIYPDENIFEISYVTTVGGIPEYTIIGYHNAGAGVFLNWFGSNVRINSLFIGATQYWQIQKTSDSTIFRINGNSGNYGGVQFESLSISNSDHHYMSFNFIP